MSYKKMTFEDFASALKAGKYSGRAGAKRAVGKSSWSADSKNKANDLVDGVFPEKDKPAKGKPGRKPGRPAKAKPEMAEAAGSKTKVGKNKFGTTIKVGEPRIEQYSDLMAACSAMQVGLEALRLAAKEQDALKDSVYEVGSAYTRVLLKVESTVHKAQISSAFENNGVQNVVAKPAFPSLGPTDIDATAPAFGDVAE